jgi:uncharacterized protein (TIRG00374 family)
MKIFINKVNPNNHKVSIFELYLIYFTGLFFGSVTPSKVGELVKIRYLKKFGNKEAFYIVFADRLWDAFFILFFAGMSFYFLGFEKYFYIGLTVSIILFSIIFIFYKIGILKKFKKYIPKKISKFIGTEYYKYSIKEIISLSFYTIISFIMYFIWYYLLMYMLGIFIPAFKVFWIQSITVFVNILPISVMGLGTREAINLHFFKEFGYNNENVMAFGFVIMFFYIINIVSGFLFWNLLEHIIKRRPEFYEV